MAQSADRDFLIFLGINQCLAALAPFAAVAAGHCGVCALCLRVLLVHGALGVGTATPEPVKALTVLPHLDRAIL